MSAHGQEPSQALITALRESDELRRDTRAKRLAWVSRVPRPEGLIVGPMDTMQMIEEARACFTDGHFAAVILLACSVIEHLLTDALKEHQLNRGGKSFSDAIDTARSKGIYRGELLDCADGLRTKRNAFAHRKPSQHQQLFPSRYMTDGRHPNAILEDDAKSALELMYEFLDAYVGEG